jgi:hypothetical protein
MVSFWESLLRKPGACRILLQLRTSSDSVGEMMILSSVLDWAKRAGVRSVTNSSLFDCEQGAGSILAKGHSARKD